MPRSETEPDGGAAADPKKRQLWSRRKEFGKKESVSLDSADGLILETSVPGATATAAVATATTAAGSHKPPAGRAATHESGSLSDVEEANTDHINSVISGLSFSKFRLSSKREKSLPPLPDAKKPAEKPQSPKTKARRVDRLWEFTERLRNTDLKWSREEKPAPMSPPARSPPRPAASPEGTASGERLTAEKPPSHPPRRHRRKARPPRPPPVAESAKDEAAAPRVVQTAQTGAGSDRPASLRERPLSAGDLPPPQIPTSKSSPSVAASAPPPLPAEAPAAIPAVQSTQVTSAPNYYSQPRTIPFRSASFSRVDSCGMGNAAKTVGKSPITIQPVYFSINKPGGRPINSQTLPKKFKTHRPPPEEEVAVDEHKPVHTRHKSDSLVEMDKLPREEDSPVLERATSQRDSMLLEALLKEINAGTSSFLGHDEYPDDFVPESKKRVDKNADKSFVQENVPAAEKTSSDATAKESTNETVTPTLAVNLDKKSGGQGNTSCRTSSCPLGGSDSKSLAEAEMGQENGAASGETGEQSADARLLEAGTSPTAADQPPGDAKTDATGSMNEEIQDKQDAVSETGGVAGLASVAGAAGSINGCATSDVGGPGPEHDAAAAAAAGAGDTEQMSSCEPAAHRGQPPADAVNTEQTTPAEGDQPESDETSRLRVQQAQIDVLNINLDQLDETPSELSPMQESLRQAVKMAVETLLSEVNSGEEHGDVLQTLHSSPSEEREVASVLVEGKETVDDWTGAEELTTTFTSIQEKKKLNMDITQPIDIPVKMGSSYRREQRKMALPPLPEIDATFYHIQKEVPPLPSRRFKSKSLSPIPFHAEEVPPEPIYEEPKDVLPPPPGARRAKSRSLEHSKQRSLDLGEGHPFTRPTERKRSLKQRLAENPILNLGPSNDSLSSSSSDEIRSRARSKTLDKDFSRPKSDKGRTKSHASRSRTTSDTSALRPLLSHQSHPGELLTLDEHIPAFPGQRTASPSFLSYDSDVDRFPRSPHGPRRRLRGPYGEMLEGKMGRSENYRSRDEEQLKFLSSLTAEPISASPSPARASPTHQDRTIEGPVPHSHNRHSHLAVTSDSELVDLEGPSHVRAVSSPSELVHYSDLLAGEYYDGVGRTAENLISQLSQEEAGHLRAQPRKRGRRLFIIGELLDTEQSYVESLRLLITYYQKLRSPEFGSLVDPNTLLDIFHMIPEILEIHEDFLRELHHRTDHWTNDQKIGEVFLEKLTHTSVLDTYTAFVNNWPTAREALRRACQTKPALAKLLEGLERSHKRKLSFTHLLIMPVQRIPRYELLLKQLVNHTAADHPDLEALRTALSEVHLLASRINSIERETMQNEAVQQTLREVEAAVDGLESLVAPDRVFIRLDHVNMTTALGARKERCLFLFNDLLLITSIKRRPGSTRKPSTVQPDGTLTGLEANKYKLLMRINLTDLNIARTKDENLSSLLKEVEKIEEDISTLRQIGVLVCKLHCNHHQVEELVREMANVLNRQLAERHRADTQLMQLQLSVNTQDGVDNIAVSFYEVERRTAWEQVFNETKQKLALSADRRLVPEFLYPLPIRKTRAGLQFTCASPTLSLNQQHRKDVWVCNSDGYVGQICVLSLRPEPTVTSCNGVCNSRILCIAAVPSAPVSRGDGGGGAGRPEVSSPTQGGREAAQPQRSEQARNNIDLDSSSDSDSSDESKPDEARGAGSDDPGRAPPQDQPTMWLGTEDGCIYVYNCNDYIRIKKTKVKVQLGSAVHSIVYLDGRVFVALANGTVSAYSRSEGSSSWEMQGPEVLQVSSLPVNRLVVVNGHLWACTQNLIKVINPASYKIEHTVTVSSDVTTMVQSLVPTGLGVWLSFHNMSTIRLFHTMTFDMVCEVDVTSAVTRMLSGSDDIIRQHKTACLRVTSLMVCKDLLWIGTSAGVILNLPLPHLTNNTTWLTNTLSIAGISHGHTGHVRFLAWVESGSDVAAPSRYKRTRSVLKIKDKMAHKQPTPAVSKVLVISGGDGYEDFRSSGSELSGRDDSTNHLLLWRV